MDIRAGMMVKLLLKQSVNQRGSKSKTVLKENLSQTSQTTLSRMLEPVISSRKNQDIRMQLAYAFFEEPRGNVLLMGTPRSGRTNVVVAESYNREEPVPVIEPLVRIAKETVKDALIQTDFTTTKET